MESPRRLSVFEPLHGLAGDVCDELEVTVKMQDRQSCHFGGRGDEQVRDGRSAVLTTVGERGLDLYSSILDHRREVLGRHRRERRPCEARA